MKGAFWVMICGLALSPAYAQQQSSQETPGNADNSRPAAGPSATPTPAPPPATASSPESGTTSVPQTPDEAIATDSALQTQIQDAFNKDPIFTQAGVKATASMGGIELTGDVASGRDRLNAGRIAQSYAHGKKVVNHIVVKVPGAPAGSNRPENPPANFSGSADKSGSVSPP